MKIASFAPLADEKSEILILGTMPGVMSLTKQEYYGHKQNAFWKIIYSLYASLPVAENFEDKVVLLRQNNIAVWDVLADCERKGSLDIHIKNHTYNDIDGLLQEFPRIKKVLFNGKESHKYFERQFKKIEGISYYVMPSTSPANTMKFEEKLRIWKAALLD